MPRRSPIALVVVLGVLALAGGASRAQVLDQTFGDGLPSVVQRAIDAAVRRAEDHPSLVRRADRVRHDASGLERWPIEWSLDGGLDRRWAGGVQGDASLSLALDLVDPFRERRAADLAESRELWRLERSFARRDAALEVVSGWLALWNTRQQIALLRQAASIASDDPASQRKLAAWLEDLPSLRLEASLLADRLARSSGVEPTALLSSQAWSRYLASGPALGCPDSSPGVRLARTRARARARRDEAQLRGARQPSVSAHASVAVVASDRPETPIGTRISFRLDVGAPTSWPAIGTLSLRGDEGDASLRVRLASDPSDGPVSTRADRDELALAVADAEVAAGERAALDRLTLALAQERLATLAMGAGEDGDVHATPVSTFEELEARLAWTAWTVRAVEARARLTIDCPEGRPMR